MKLKTLKDIRRDCFDDPFIKILKAEAVKKIKFIKKNHRMPTPIPTILEEIEVYLLIKYIMWENNLTEEDLK